MRGLFVLVYRLGDLYKEMRFLDSHITAGSVSKSHGRNGSIKYQLHFIENRDLMGWLGGEVSFQVAYSNNCRSTCDDDLAARLLCIKMNFVYVHNSG